MRELTLYKLGHCWIFRYEPGDEDALREALCDLVARAIGFDWFDAGVITSQMTAYDTK